MAQCYAAHNDSVLQFHRGANMPIEHPFRNFEHGKSVFVIPPATEDQRTASYDGRSHKHSLLVPGMEGITYFLNLGNMGFSLPSCTTTIGRTAH